MPKDKRENLPFQLQGLPLRLRAKNAYVLGKTLTLSSHSFNAIDFRQGLLFMWLICFFQKLFETEKTVNVRRSHRFMLFWLHDYFLAHEPNDYEIAPACDVSVYCTTRTPPCTDDERDGSVLPMTSSKKWCCHIASVQEVSSMRERWKNVVHVPTAQGVVDIARILKLKCFQPCDASFFKMEQEFFVNLSRAQHHAGLFSMLGSSVHFYFDGYHVCYKLLTKSAPFSNTCEEAFDHVSNRFLEKVLI